MNKFKLVFGLIRTYRINQLLRYYLFNKDEFQTLNLKNNLKYIIRVKSRDFNTINENEIEHNYDEYLNKINKPKIIIDVGANIGCFSIQCAKMFEKSKIYAYEPFKNTYELCKKNISLNNINNVKTYCLGVTKSSGKVEMGIYEGMFEANSINNIWGNPTKSVIIKTISLQKIFLNNNLKYCDLLKLDCEGSEYEILFNLRTKDFVKIGNIVMEYHLGREEELTKLLENNNFVVEIKKFTNKSGLLFAYKKAQLDSQ